MSRASRQESAGETFPAEFRCSVIDGKRFQLPARLVPEVGVKTSLSASFRSAGVGWYYHEEHEKAVLANDEVKRSSLEMIDITALSGVANDELNQNDASSARVTITNELPDELYEKLTTDELVLRPRYAALCPELNGTCISVYPREEYDRGSLPNVTTNRPSDVSTEENHNHANSI